MLESTCPSVGSFVRHQTKSCEQNNLKQNEPISMQIGTSERHEIWCQ